MLKDLADKLCMKPYSEKRIQILRPIWFLRQGIGTSGTLSGSYEVVIYTIYIAF